MIDSDTVEFLVTVKRGFRANRHTGGILAVLAAHGEIKALVVPFYNVNAGQGRRAHTIMLYRTNEFTGPAARAFFRIDDHYFLIHHPFPLSFWRATTLIDRKSRVPQLQGDQG
jgi:hypothetical protein